MKGRAQLRCMLFVSLLVSWLGVTVVAAATEPKAAPCVEARNGDIYLVEKTGATRQITSLGKDSMPDLSADGTTVVFVRATGADTKEIWIADISPNAQARPLVPAPILLNGRKFSLVWEPKYSPDGRYIYFMIEYASTTGGLVRVSLSNPTVEFVTAALEYQIVKSGRYRGYIVARIRKPKMAMGYYFWYWLLTPEGKEVGVVGEDARDVKMFLDVEL
jgi:dipeptidyl aminopeptidase/acylaminoacyl peptidase